MPNQFLSPDGDLERIFVDDYAMIDQFVATGSLWGWGANFNGQLGNNTAVAQSSPVQTVAGGTNWKQASTGLTTAAIKTDGRLWLSGSNVNGQLGDNTTVDKSSPVQTIASGTNWKQVATSEYHVAAIKTDGTLWLWGRNTTRVGKTTTPCGQLGDNTGVNKSSPVQTVSGGTNWKQVSVGISNSAAIKTDGTLWTWGRNNNYQLGDGTATDRSSPVQTIAGGTNWKYISCGDGHCAAIKTDGTLWTWGYNGLGSLGDNTSISKSSPVQTVSGGTNWKQVAANSSNTAAIKTDGTLWLWGNNNYGQIGNNTSGNAYSSPIQTVAGGTNWKQVAVDGHIAAIKTDGTLWTWGRNNNYQLGDGTATSRSSPVQTIAGGTNWKQLEANGDITVAVKFYDAGNM